MTVKPAFEPVGSVEVAGVTIPKWDASKFPEDVRALVPTRTSFVVTDDMRKWVRRVALNASAGTSTMLWGEPGAGKTAILEHFAFLQQRPLVVTQCDRNTEPSQMIGGLSLRVNNGATETGFTATEGVAASIVAPTLWVFDELPAAPHEARQAVRPITEQRGHLPLSTYDGRIVRIQPNVWPCATGNEPWGPRNIGIAPMDEADNSRFAHVQVPYNTAATEFRVLLGRGADNAAERLAAAMVVRVMMELRKSDFPLACGTRASLTAYRLMRAGASLHEAVECVFSYEDPNLWRTGVSVALDAARDAAPSGESSGVAPLAAVLGIDGKAVDAIIAECA